MTVVRVKGFQVFKDRHGRQRCYHRRSGAAIDLVRHPIGSASFFTECARVAELAAAKEAKPGTLGKLIESYRGHASFRDLAERTRADYQRVFDYLKPIADTPLAKFTRPFVVKLRDRTHEARGRRFANYVKAVLSVLFGWGAERGFLKDNPASGIKDIRRKRGAPEANRPWSDAEREAVLEAAPAHIKAAIALMMFTGLGPKDAFQLPRSMFRDGEIAIRRSKTGVPVFLPMMTRLREVLDATPAHGADTVLASSRGTPWTESGFGSSWARCRRRLEMAGKIGPGLTPYGLRHTMATIIRESGEDERSIADALGQIDIKTARHYARRADLGPKMRKLSPKLEVEFERRRREVSNPAGETVKPGGGAT